MSLLTSNLRVHAVFTQITPVLHEASMRPLKVFVPVIVWFPAVFTTSLGRRAVFIVPLLIFVALRFVSVEPFQMNVPAVQILVPSAAVGLPFTTQTA